MVSQCLRAVLPALCCMQSNEVALSYHMEKEGLVRGFDFFKSNNLSIELFVTD